MQDWERYPDKALGFLDTLLEREESRWLERQGAGIFHRALNAISFADLVVHSPAYLSSTIRLIRFFKDRDTMGKAVHDMELFLEGKDAIPLMSKQLTLETLPELRWLAEESGSTKLKGALDIVSGLRTV